MRYVVRLHFPASNNMAEYEALLSGIRIAIELGVKCLDVRGDSQLIIDQVMKESSCHDAKMEAYCERKWRSLHQCLEHTAATSLLSLKFQAICTSLVLVFKISRGNKKYALLIYLWELSEPSGARMRTNTEVHSALPSAKPSLPRGLLRGEPLNVPKLELPTSTRHSCVSPISYFAMLKPMSTTSSLKPRPKINSLLT